MLKQYSNLAQRAFSALVAIPIIVTAVCWNVWSYFLFFFFIVALTLLEFYKLVRVGGAKPHRFWGILSGLLTYTFVFMYASGWMTPRYLYGLAPIIALIFPITLYLKEETTPFTNIAYTILGIVYVSVPFAMLHLFAFSQGFYNYQLVLGILLLLWANDIGAYMVGSTIGQHKLFKRISAKKSWEGSIGGGVLALLVSYFLAKYFRTLSLGAWLAIGSIIIVVGIYGDLVESMLKRSINLKDSGKLIPGHGGLLDRFDSYLLSMPFILAFVKLFL